MTQTRLQSHHAQWPWLCKFWFGSPAVELMCRAKQTSHVAGLTLENYRINGLSVRFVQCFAFG